MNLPFIKGTCIIAIKDFYSWLFPPSDKIRSLVLKAANKEFEEFPSEHLKILEFQNLPTFHILNIAEAEYLIEKNNENIIIANYEYIKKRLFRLDGLLGNYRAAQKIKITIKNELFKNAQDSKIQNISKIIEAIDGIFVQVHKYHTPTTFDPKWQGEHSNFDVLVKTESEVWWFNTIQTDYIKFWNSLFLGLRELFNKLSAKEFYEIRNFILLELSKIKLDITSKGFYFINSPFEDDIKNLGSKLNTQFSDEKISLKKQLGIGEDYTMEVARKYYNEPYDGRFSVSETKRIFQLTNGQTKTLNVDNTNLFDLLNFNIYDESTGQLIEIAEQHKYNTNFISRLIKVDPLKVEGFLNYHFDRSENQEDLYKYVDRIVLNNASIKKRLPIKKGVEEWINSAPLTLTKIEVKKDTKENINPQKSHTNNSQEVKNPHPDIFNNYKAYQLFQNLHDLKKNEVNVLVEYSFIYRIMHNEGLIKERIRPEMFRAWLSKKPFEVETEYKLKTLANCSPKNRIDVYNLQKKILGIEIIP